MTGLKRTKEMRKWQGEPVYNTDNEMKSVDDTDDNIHLSKSQVGQRRRWQRVHRVQDKIAKKQLSKDMPMEETKVTKAREWLQKLDKKEKGDSLDELWGKAALGAGALTAYHTNLIGPAIKGTGKLAYDYLPGVKPVTDAAVWTAGVPGRVAGAVGSGVSSGYQNVAGGLTAGKAAVSGAAAKSVPSISALGAKSSGGAAYNIGAQAVFPGVIGYSVGALVGLLSRIAAHRKYRVDRNKLAQVMHIPRTTEPQDVAAALDWFGFHHQAGMIRAGKGDPIIALENILRALNGDKQYVNPMTGGMMIVKEKVPMFNMGKKVALIADVTASLQNAHEYMKDFKFSYMIQERFKWEKAGEYYAARAPLEEEALVVALVALTASLGFIQFGKLKSLLGQIDTKLDKLMTVRDEKEALRLVAGIVDAFDFNIGKDIIRKKSDPLLALQLVMDYLEGNRRTRNPKNGYKISTPIKPVATIPFGAANSAHELLGYIEEVNDLIKKLKQKR
jgi:hypothetical protein